MYRDVLDAALGCPALDGVAAVTRDGELLSIAEEAGAQPMPEPGGLNEALDSAAGRYQFNVFADTLYDFVWHEVCDRYLEAIKPTVDDNPTQQVVLGAVLDSVLRIMHPVCPFVTEALWPHVSTAQCGEISGVNLSPSPLLATALWPSIDDSTADEHAVDLFDRANQLIRLIRALRSERNVKPRQMLSLHVTDNVAALIERTDGVVETLAGVGEVLAIEIGRASCRERV